MRIGTPTEIKNNEYRVALTPAGALTLVHEGHEVYIEKGAGKGSGFTDEMYKEVGAKIVANPDELFEIADMIVKVKEPLAEEYSRIRKGQIVFTYFHFASSKELTDAMIASDAICIAYETVKKNGTLPLLTPMSEVAGRLSIQQGAKYLEKPQLGKGKLLGGVPGVQPANVMVIGAGVVGTQAALMASGLGANVSILDINLDRLRYLSEVLPINITTLYSSKHAIQEMLPLTDVVIGAVLIPGAKAPNLITKEDLKLMEPGTVLVDVAIDQGGCFETSHPTTHKDPIFLIDDVVHYCVANMPGAVPKTSTMALTNATLPYVISIANHGWKEAAQKDAGLMAGVSMVNGKVTCPEVAHTFDLPLKKVV